MFVPFAGSSFQTTVHERQMRALRNLEKEWLAGENNPEVLKNILADDFVHVLPFGFITKQDQIDYLRKHKAVSTTALRHFEDLRIRVYGETAIVNGIVVAEGKPGRAPRKTLFTDVFVFRDSRWQAVNAQELPLAQSRPESHP